MINIIAIGGKPESWVIPGLERYQKRLKAPWDVRWHLLPHAPGDEVSARRDESRAIAGKLERYTSPYVILLDERGTQLASPALSQRLEDGFTRSEVVIIIGGAYGVSAQLREQADLVLSLSKLVFPHQLVRLLLIEQLYRCQEIARGGPYHHE